MSEIVDIARRRSMVRHQIEEARRQSDVIVIVHEGELRRIARYAAGVLLLGIFLAVGVAAWAGVFRFLWYGGEWIVQWVTGG